MTTPARAIAGLAAIGIGWGLMVLAYDKPEWYFQTAGILGALLTVSALIWWPVSAYRARLAASKEGANDL
jgi:hypothetical protein